MKTRTKLLQKLCLLLSFFYLTSPAIAQHSCGVAGHIEHLRSHGDGSYEDRLANYARFVNRAIVRGRYLKSNLDETCPNGITILPIAFHIFHDGTDEGIGYNYSNDDLALVVDGLNADFSGYRAAKERITREFYENEGGHTCIQFAIGKINRINTRECDRWKVDATHADLHHCLPGGSGVGSANDPNDYLNIYITKLADGMLGMASSIPMLYGQPNADDDGVTISRDIVIPGKSIYSRYNQGSVLTHEVAHWLGLPHVNGDIHGSGCAADDGFSDTYPQISQQFFDCGETELPESCSSVDNVYNYMDYSADCAKLQFTEQQVSTMHAVLATERATLAKSVARGNHDRSLYNFHCKIFEANQRIFEYEILDCYGEVNFLAYQTKWYPSFYDSDNPVGGLTRFVWQEETDGKAVSAVSSKKLAKSVISHETDTYTDVRIYKLYMQCWDPYKLRYSTKQIAGKLMTVLKKCDTPENDAITSAQRISMNDCHDANYSLNNATPTKDVSLCGDSTAVDVWFSTMVSSNTGISLCVDGVGDLADPAIEIYAKRDSALVCIATPESSTVDLNDTYAGMEIFVRVVGADASLFTICASEMALQNDNKTDAIELAVSETCSEPKIYSNYGATPSVDLSDRSICGRNDRLDDVWFFAQMPASGRLTVETSQVDGGVKEVIMEAYAEIDGELIPVACSSIKEYWPSYDRHAHVEIVDLAPGTRIYLRVFANGLIAEGEFGLCAYSGEPEATCRISYIEVLEQGQCDGESNTYSQSLRVHYRSSGSDDFLYVNNQQFELTGSPQVITLVDLPANGRTVNVSANIGRNANNPCWRTSFYKTYKLFAAPEGCYTNALANDDCVGAIELGVGTECHGELYSSTGATYSTDATAYFSCGVSGFRPDDVWFKAMVTETGIMTISSPLLYNENNMILEAYAGTCDAMELVGCDQFSGVDGSEIVLTDRTPGEWIYIRVADQGNNTQGDFLMCVYDHEPAANVTGAVAADDITIYAPAEQLEVSTEISVYPNPAVDVLHISSGIRDASVSLFSTSGALMKATTLGDAYRTSLDVSELRTGLYYVQVRGADVAEVSTVMIYR